MARYHDIAAEIRTLLDSGSHPAGSQLPHLADLAQQYGVSRQTITFAIQLLQNEGRVRTVRHVGTFVLDKAPVQVRLSRYSGVLSPGGSLGPWESACARQGLDGFMETVEVAVEAAPADVAEALGVPAGSEVVRRSRRALLDGRPVQIHTSWLPHDLVAGTPLEGAEKVVGGVYGALVAAGHVPATADETNSARAASPDEVAELRLRGAPVLVTERMTRDADGRVLEFLRIVADSTRTVMVYDQLPLARG